METRLASLSEKSEKKSEFFRIFCKHYMDISVSVSLMDKCILIMAVPIYVPEGIGPIVDNNNNTTISSTNYTNYRSNVSNNFVPNYNNYNNNYNTELVNNQVNLENRTPLNQLDEIVQLEEDWTFELKLSVRSWRQTGIELRAIADQFHLENGRRSPRGRRRAFKCRLLNVNIALPALAFLGLGLAWFRRHVV